MPVRLTETAIRAAIAKAGQTGRRDLADAALPGLRLRLTPAGAATWALACRDTHGRMRRFPLGPFPAMGLSEARDKARALRVRVREGEDPVAERRRARALGRDAKEGIGTLAALLELYGAGPGAALKTWREAARRVAVVFAPHLRRPLASLKAGELQMTADGYPARQSAAAAVRYLRPVLKWGAKRGYVAREAALIEPPATVKRRDRVLAREELAALLPALTGGQRGSVPPGLAVHAADARAAGGGLRGAVARHRPRRGGVAHPLHEERPARTGCRSPAKPWRCCARSARASPRRWCSAPRPSAAGTAG